MLTHDSSPKGRAKELCANYVYRQSDAAQSGGVFLCLKLQKELRSHTHSRKESQLLMLCTELANQRKYSIVFLY